MFKARNRIGRLLANHQAAASFANFHESPMRASTLSCSRGRVILIGRPAKLAADRVPCLDGQIACRIWGTPSHPGPHRRMSGTLEARAVRRRTRGMFSDQGPWKKTRSSGTRHLPSTLWPRSRELPLTPLPKNSDSSLPLSLAGQCSGYRSHKLRPTSNCWSRTQRRIGALGRVLPPTIAANVHGPPTGNKQKSRRGGTPKGLPPRRLTR